MRGSENIELFERARRDAGLEWFGSAGVKTEPVTRDGAALGRRHAFVRGVVCLIDVLRRTFKLNDRRECVFETAGSGIDMSNVPAAIGIAYGFYLDVGRRVRRWYSQPGPDFFGKRAVNGGQGIVGHNGDIPVGAIDALLLVSLDNQSAANLIAWIVRRRRDSRRYTGHDHTT